jgi:hypothetical protein
MNIRSLASVTVFLASLMLLNLSASSQTHAATFTNGNVAVYRAGPGTGALSADGNPVFIDEYTPTGTLVQSIALPTTNIGLNRRLVTAGSSTSEGFLTRSTNGACLVLSGYDAVIPTTALSGTTSALTNRVIGVINNAGTIDTTTALTDHASGSNPRSVASDDCSKLWVGGGAGGVRFTNLGATTSTALNATFTNVRQVSIFAGQLYFSTQAGTTRMATMGTGLPTTAGQTATALNGVSTTADASAFFFADLDPAVPGVDTLYVADELNGVGHGLLKYSLVGTTWTANGIVGTGADDYRGLTGVVTGTTVTLYATRKGGNVNAQPAELVQIVDTTGYNATITATPTVLATGSANTTFHGIALVPISPNKAPTITAPAGITVLGNVASSLAGITFADPDAGGLPVTVTLGVASGTLSATTGGGVTVAGSGTGALTLTGSIANINAFITAGSATFTTALNVITSVTLAIGIDDGGNTGTGGALTASANTTLTVTPNPIVCAAGTFSATGNAPCTTASPGNYVPTAGATAQIPAPAGSFVATAGATAPTLCSAGTFSATTGAITCTQAGLGFFVPTAGATSQTACGVGTTTLTLGATVCVPILLNVTPAAGANGGIAPSAVQIVTYGSTKTFTITASAGFSASVATGAGQCGGTLSGTSPNYSYTTAAITANCGVTASFTAIPVQCLAGTFSATGNAPCTTASPGNFVPSAGATSQTPAPAGSFVATAGATAATLCSAGTFSAATGAIACTSATAGNFVPTIGATAQTPASAGSFVATAGASTQTLCAPGSFSPTTGATACTLAALGFFVPNAGATSQTACSSGTTTLTTGATVCVPITFAVTPVAGTNGTISPTTPQIVNTGNTATFIITANAGFNATVATGAGECGGVLTGATPNYSYTTAAVTAACNVSVTFVAIQPQSITGFAPISPVIIGTAPVVLTATGGSSGNAVVFASITPSTCTVAGNTVTFVAVGTCNLTADQAGNVNYFAAPQVSASIIINPVSQTIAFGTNPGPVAYNPGGTFIVTATATSLLPVVFSSASTTICMIVGSTVTIVTVGNCIINANQAGNAIYGAAPQVQQTIAINAAPQTITFPAIAGFSWSGGSAALAATSSSGLAVSYSVVSGPCAISASTVTATGAGACTIAANQAGNTSYNAASQVTQSVTVSAAPQTITFPAIPTFSWSGGSATLAATASSGLAISYSVVSGTCAISGTTLTATTGGACVIAANQAGNTNFTAAAQVTQSVTVSAIAQTITFPATPTFSWSGGSATLAATASSGLTVSYSVASGPCAIAGNTLTAISAGSCVIAANQAGNASYNAAPQVTQSVTVSAAPQTITFPAIPTFSWSGGSATLAATASSGLAVTYGVVSGPCSISGTTLTATTSGICSIAANQTGNANYSTAAQVTQSATITAAAQTITFPAIAGFSWSGGSAALAATSSSGLAVSYSVVSGPCAISASTVTATGAGACTIAANQAGNTSYNAAPQVTQSVTVSAAPQTITFPAIPTFSWSGGAATLAASSSSGLAIIYSVVSGPCAVAGNTLTATSAGSCVIAANQAGNANYSAAAQLTQSATITAAAQTITGFAPVSPVVFGAAPATLTAIGGASGLPIVFATTSAATICTVAGSTVTFTGVGICNLTANQAGNANYTAATPVSAAITITPASQVITFAALTDRVFGTPFTVAATGGASGNPVTFSTITPTTCTVVGTTVTLATTGICTIRASQAGNANYSAAADVNQSFTITSGPQTITFPAITSFVWNSGSATLGATASSALTVTYSVASGPCSIAGTTLTATGAGTCSVTASQAGNATFNAATPVTNSVTILKAPQTITFGTLPNQVFSRTYVEVSRGRLESGAPADLTSLTPSVCALSTTVFFPGASVVAVDLLAVGTCTFRASYPGDDNYLPAASVDQSFQITPAVSTIPREFTLAPNIINPRAGTPITLTALIRGIVPNGVVSFTTTLVTDIINPTVPVVGCTNITVSLLQADTNSAVATCTTFAEAGARRYTATYSNDNVNAVNPAVITTNSPAVGPNDYNDIWWAGPSESGWGMTIAQKGLQQFNAFYVYDASGKPIWYVMAGGTWNADYTRFSGAIYQPTGSLFSAYDSRRWQIGAAVGTGTLTFTNANNAVFDYTLNGVTAKKNITRFIYGTPDAAPKITVKDIWWGGEAENGWGVAIAQQDRSLFAAWYTYDIDGKTTWFVMAGGTWQGTTFTGQLYTTTSSPWLGVPYNAAQFRTQSVGTLSFDFRDQDNAKMTYTVNGVTQTKSISRFGF